MLVSRSMTCDDGVFIPSNNYFFLLLLFVELPKYVVFPDLNLPRAGPQDVRFFDCFCSCGADTV